MTRAVLVFLFLFFLLSFGSQAQRALKWAIPLRIEGGVNLSTLETSGGESWSQYPGGVLGLGSGIALRKPMKWGCSLEADMLLDEYNYNRVRAEYTVTYFLIRPRANFYALIKRKDIDHLHWRIGMDFGYSFSGSDFLESTLDGTVIRTQEVGEDAFFTAPGFGICDQTKFGTLSCVLTYFWHHTSTPLLTTNFISSSGEVFASSRSNYIAARVRLMFDLPDNRKTKIVMPPRSFNDFMNREVRVRKELKAKREKLILQVWDNAEIDGDTISIQLNGKYVLTEYPLQRKKKKIKLYLKPGSNTIAIHAHNEGTIKPNTAACKVRNGWFKEEFVISTALDRSEWIVVEY